MSSNLTAGVTPNGPTEKVPENKRVEAVGKAKETEVTQDVIHEHTAEQQQANSYNKQMDAKQISKKVQEVEAHVQSVQRDLHFQIDETTGETVISVYDSATDELIRQIPTEEVMKMKQIMASARKGILFDTKV